MKKIDKKHYSKYIELAKANTCNTVYPMAIAEGIQEGDIYADSIINPTYALFWHVSGFAYLSGQPDEKELEAIYKRMQNKDEANNRRFVLELKDETVAAYFQNKADIEKHPRYRFRLREEALGDRTTQEPEIPIGYELKEVDAELLSKISGRIVPLSFWSSEEDFLREGKGYCFVCDGEVVAVAFSAAVSSEQIDVGIETKEAHRRRGLAAIAAREMATYVKDIGKEPVWDCDAANKGSRATAEKIGFEVVAEHAYYKVCENR